MSKKKAIIKSETIVANTIKKNNDLKNHFTWQMQKSEHKQTWSYDFSDTSEPSCRPVTSLYCYSYRKRMKIINHAVFLVLMFSGENVCTSSKKVHWDPLWAFRVIKLQLTCSVWSQPTSAAVNRTNIQSCDGYRTGCLPTLCYPFNLFWSLIGWNTCHYLQIGL